VTAAEPIIAGVDAQVRAVLDTHARLSGPASALGAHDDLYAAGMTSHASVNVMLALEDAFDIEFPDELLTKTTFCTLERLEQAVASLQGVSA
jgi:acyl carrier protein